MVVGGEYDGVSKAVVSRRCVELAASSCDTLWVWERGITPGGGGGGGGVIMCRTTTPSGEIGPLYWAFEVAQMQH